MKQIQFREGGKEKMIQATKQDDGVCQVISPVHRVPQTFHGIFQITQSLPLNNKLNILGITSRSKSNAKESYASASPVECPASS